MILLVLNNINLVKRRHCCFFWFTVLLRNFVLCIYIEFTKKRNNTVNQNYTLIRLYRACLDIPSLFAASLTDLYVIPSMIITFLLPTVCWLTI